MFLEKKGREEEGNLRFLSSVLVFLFFLMSANMSFAQSGGSSSSSSSSSGSGSGSSGGGGGGGFSWMETASVDEEDTEDVNEEEEEENAEEEDTENTEDTESTGDTGDTESTGDINNDKQLAIEPPLSCPLERKPLYTKPFNDVPKVWYFDEIEDLRKNGIFGGYKSGNNQDNPYSGNFGPSNNINRAEIATMILNIKRCDMGCDIYKTTKKDPYQGNIPYSDVSQSSWYASYSVCSDSKGLLTMKSGKRFAPADFVTRAEAVSVIIKGLGKKEEKSSFNFADTKGRHDSNLLGFAHDKNYVSGHKDGNFYPNNLVNRAEVAVIVHAVLKDLGEI